ncbi:MULTISPECIES: diguanylate cyclase [Methylomonas]|uniref:diguanylate cyclase n=2 Tax=Methylomonas TaxID=416 RepID=A0A126T9A6_9GAMM|nr:MULTISPECIES: diguanylate cyclase [Methylomonas]AMK78657.1 diguanylate cyclase response regulator [Methylomonas denitrificans]OAI03656.1 diguanylate cyclase response regulator [Methylomonas methanica]TCV83591.1 response regulator receiver modulated diguanylate cyclase [Methylomonas methanica]
MKILVVDDSKVIRQLVAECLKEMGHAVAYAGNGSEALQYVADHDVDLILMDVEMPFLSGFEATKAIRELKKSDWFPIIFLTMHDDDQSFVNGILAGGDAYLPKPLNPTRLRLTVIAMERIYVMRQKLQKTQRELQAANLELERLSLRDQLTGLGNRRHFDSNLTMQFALSRRNKAPLSLIICDIDYFKNYNDSLGHPQGDACLIEVAKVITEQLERSSDLICRYGGEEFVAILPDTPLHDARTLAENIRRQVFETDISYGEAEARRVSLSLGVATYVGQYKTEQEMVEAADAALYKAKQNGRNRVEIN